MNRKRQSVCMCVCERERETEREGGRRKRERERQRDREREIETDGLNEEGGEREKENAWKVGSFAAGSNDPGCIDSWGCSVVRVADRRRE